MLNHMTGIHLLAWLLLHCSAARGIAIVGAGSTLPAQVFADAQFAYRFANPNVELEYYASDSQAGVCRIESFADECNPADTRALDSLDFAATTTILNQSDYDNYTDIQLYPVLATPIVPVYNLNGVQGLILARTTLTQIFYGLVTTWDDARIRAYNPNFSQWNISTKQRIQVVVRKDDADITLVFKQALYKFYAQFANYVEMSSRSSWGTLNVVRLEGQEAVNSYILQTPWTISYSSLKDAIDANVLRAPIWKGTNVVVDASVKTTTFAVLETGLAFGNNGDDPSHLTADLNYALGVNAWPIVTYTYIALRKSTLRAGATCANVRNTVAFWQWFLTANVIQSIAEAQYSVQPPSVVLDIVVQRLVSDVTCLGQPVFQAAQAQEVTAAGEASVAHVLEGLAEVYATTQPQLSMEYTSSPLNTSDAVAAALAANQFVAVRQPGLAPPAGAATLLFAGVAVVVISQYDLVLDIPTLVRILEGDIQTWLDPALVALNPGGFQDSFGGNVSNASQPILLLNGPTADSSGFHSLMLRYAPDFTGRALQAAYKLRSDEQLQTVVAGTPGTLAIATSALGQTSSRVQFASLRSAGGVPVAPSPASIRACAAAAAYSPTAGMDLASTSVPGCYPLSDAVYLVVRTPQCANASALDTDAVAFLQWALEDNNTAEALEGDGVALLADVSPAVKTATAQALASLTCASTIATNDSSSTDIVPIVVGACVGAFFVIAVPIAWYVWKSGRDMRALRKQFSDVKVAEDCAEAIACFDLETVSWLANLSKPTKIQLAFLRIVSLLMEVKPFIPDQLLAQLQKRDAAPARQSRRDSDHTLATSQSQNSFHSSSLHSGRSGRIARNDSAKGQSGRLHTSASDGSGGVRRVGRGGRVAPSNSDSVPGGAGVDRFRRTCTYMYVRFVITGNPEADRLGQLATTVAAHVVTLGKAHGATIDKVTYDSVALHWNVSTQCGGAPLQATSLAMELACAAQILAPEFQSDLRLLVGIGHGPSTVATVSAAGQRFFVVGGPEIANAVDVVMREAALPLGCAVLLSNAVQQEVKYGFRCSPRLWFRDVLFWEPVQKRGCKVDDEWMYQIKNMEEDDTATDVNRAMHDVFLLARNGPSGGVLQREVRHVLQTYADQLTPQDLASLRCLQDPSGSRPQPTAAPQG